MPFMTKETVLANGEIDGVSDRDTGRVSVVVFCAGGRNAKARSAETVRAGADGP